MPWDLQVSAVYQNVAGIPISGVVPINNQGQIYGDPIQGASYVATNDQIAPSLKRNLGACGTNPTCTATVAINLLAPYTGGFEKNLNQFDVRLTKIVRVGHVRVQGMFDVYNVFNANTILDIVNRYGSAWLRPTQILAGRLFKFGAQLDF